MHTDSKARYVLEQAYIEMLWRRMKDDPALFFRHCIFIPSQRDDRGREEFELFDYQRDDLETFLDNRFVVVLKARQLGLSTLVGALALHRAIFYPGSVILWISNNQDNASKAVGMLDVMWRFMPAWARERAPRLTSDQTGKKEWTFADGMTSRVRTFAGTKTAGASETATIAILDEFGLVDDQDNLLRSVTPTTDAGGSLWMISTARGGHNRFAQTYRGAVRGENRYVPIFHPWTTSRFVNPLAAEGGVDTSVYDAKAKDFAEEPWLFHAEYPASAEEAFRESGRPRFLNLPDPEDCEDQWVRGEVERRDDGTIVFLEIEDGPLRVHADVLVSGPDPWREYVMFVDPATGTGGDYTAAQVLTYDDDALPTRVAWWHHNLIEPVEAARQFEILGRYFTGDRGPALIAIERTGGWGGSMITELRVHAHYPRLYSYMPKDKNRAKRGAVVGFDMSKSQRPLVIDTLAQYVTTAVPQGPLLGGIDEMLRFELSTFVRTEDGKLQADTGTHDDLVTSTGGALYVLLHEAKAVERPTHGPALPGHRTASTRHSLDDMFRQIEETRRTEQARAERQTRRHRQARAMTRRRRTVVR